MSRLPQRNPPELRPTPGQYSRVGGPSAMCSSPGHHDNKLRKYSDFVNLKFYWIHCFNNLQIWEQNLLLKISLKFWFIYKTTSKVILVWNFDLRIFSVYGHGTSLLKPLFYLIASKGWSWIKLLSFPIKGRHCFCLFSFSSSKYWTAVTSTPNNQEGHAPCAIVSFRWRLAHWIIQSMPQTAHQYCQLTFLYRSILCTNNYFCTFQCSLVLSNAVWHTEFHWLK